MENDIKIIGNVDWLNFHETNQEISFIMKLNNHINNKYNIEKWSAKLVIENQKFEIPKYKNLYYFELNQDLSIKRNQNKYIKNKINISVDENGTTFGIFIVNNNKNKNKTGFFKVYIDQI